MLVPREVIDLQSVRLPAAEYAFDHILEARHRPEHVNQGKDERDVGENENRPYLAIKQARPDVAGNHREDHSTAKELVHARHDGVDSTLELRRPLSVLGLTPGQEGKHTGVSGVGGD